MSPVHEATYDRRLLDAGIPRALVLLLVVTAGLGVATIYYSQPILGILGASLQIDARRLAFIPTLTQTGYALGILLLAPLGDRYDRRTIILGKMAILALALLGNGLASGMAPLLAASLFVGLTATLAQDVVPSAAALAPAAERGKVVGTVMTGLLLGILLSRVASGLIAERFGWRTVYFAGAASIVASAALAWRWLPAIRPTTRLGYAALIGSLLGIWRQHAELRRAVWAQGLLSVGFSAFWSTLALMLHSDYQLGSAAAGAFGLAGAAGALAAPLAGRLADRHGARRVTLVGAGWVLASFALIAAGLLLSPAAQFAVLVVGTVSFDFGIQLAFVGHQTLIYGIDAQARSRLNALLICGAFIGMASGSAVGGLAFARYGWPGVVALCLLAAGAALAVRWRAPGAAGTAP